MKPAWFRFAGRDKIKWMVAAVVIAATGLTGCATTSSGPIDINYYQSSDNPYHSD